MSESLTETHSEEEKTKQTLILQQILNISQQKAQKGKVILRTTLIVSQCNHNLP